MLLICEGIFFFLGLYIMVTGRFRLTRSRLVTGQRARLAGLILFLPGPIALLMGLIVGTTAGSIARFQQMIVPLTIVEILMVLSALVAAVWIGLTAPPQPEISALTGAPQFTPDILTMSEAAQYLRVSEADIRQMITEGRLKALAIGDDYRISRRVLDSVFSS